MRTSSITPVKYSPQIEFPPIRKGCEEDGIAPLADWLATKAPVTCSFAASGPGSLPIVNNEYVYPNPAAAGLIRVPSLPVFVPDSMHQHHRRHRVEAQGPNDHIADADTPTPPLPTLSWYREP